MPGMRISFLFFCVLLVFFSCRKNKTAGCPTTEYKYAFKSGAKLDTISSHANWLVATPGNGNKLLFTYKMNYTTCPEIADGGLSHILYFEADPSANSFEYNTGSLQDAMVYFRRICYCPENGFVVPESGTIKGTRLNANSWRVEFDIVISNNERVKNTGVFIRE